MRRLAVIHLMNSFVDSSISRTVLRVVENLRDDISWHIGALTGTGDMQADFADRGCRVVEFTGTLGISSSRSIRNYVRERGISVIHTHTPRSILEASIALRKLAHVKHVATKQSLIGVRDRRWGLAVTLWDRLSLYVPDIIVPVSDAMRKEITSQPFIDPRKVVVVRNAIPIDDFCCGSERVAARQELGLASFDSVIGYSGRIEKVKRVDLLLRAFKDVLAQTPHARLVIAGDGSMKRKMEALAQQLRIAHAVRWLGFIRDTPRLLAAIDVYVQPSSNEGLSLSILEAMAAGRPVVATAVGGAAEIIVDGRSGVLIPPRSQAAIVAALLYLLGDPSKCAAMSDAARARVASEFNIQKMVDGYGAVYAAVAAASPQR